MSATVPAAPGLHGRVRVQRAAFGLDVELSVPAGAVVAVLGPNGAGKSTLLRAVAGLVASSGALVLDGRRLDDLPPAQRGVGVVFADQRLFPHLSALENVAFGPRATGTPRREARADAQALLDRLGLGALAARRPAQLSGGQGQRVALARALAGRPGALLLDEPLSALDAGTREAVRTELGRALADVAVPVLLVTHDLLDALALADRVLVLEDGALVQDAVPAELLAAPQTAYVARLAGLDLFSGTTSAGAVAVDPPAGGRLPLPPGAPEGRVLAAVRPAGVRLARVGGEPDERTGDELTAAGGEGWAPVRVAATWLLADRVRVELVPPPAAGAARPAPRPTLPAPLLAEVDAPRAARLGLRVGLDLLAAVPPTAVSVYHPSWPGRSTTPG